MTFEVYFGTSIPIENKSYTLKPSGHRHPCMGFKILTSSVTKLLPHKACFPIRRSPFPDLWSLNAAEMGTFEEQSWDCEEQATQSFAHSCMDSEAPAQYIPAAGDNDTQE